MGKQNSQKCKAFKVSASEFSSIVLEGRRAYSCRRVLAMNLLKLEVRHASISWVAVNFDRGGALLTLVLQCPEGFVPD